MAMLQDDPAHEHEPLLQDGGDEDLGQVAPNPKTTTFSLRSTAVGLVIGTLVALSNTYFGLQTGHSDSMGVPSAILGFLAFHVFDRNLHTPFSPSENAYIQGVAGAVGSMPMTSGLISTIVGLEHVLPKSEGGGFHFSWLILIIWSLGLCFFGGVFAMFIRSRILDQERLVFPSATASATIIKSLHRSMHSKLAPSPVEEEHLTAGEGRFALQTQQSLEFIAPASTYHAVVAFAISGLLVCTVLIPSPQLIKADSDRHFSLLLYRSFMQFHSLALV